MITRRCVQRQFLLRPSKFLNDALDVIFPGGTVGMRKRYGVRCAPAPS